MLTKCSKEDLLVAILRPCFTEEKKPPVWSNLQNIVKYILPINYFIRNYDLIALPVFTSHPFRAVRVLVTPRESGWVVEQMGGRWEKVCPGRLLETRKCRKFILGRDIAWERVGVQHHGVTLI